MGSDHRSEDTCSTDVSTTGQKCNSSRQSRVVIPSDRGPRQCKSYAMYDLAESMRCRMSLVRTFYCSAHLDRQIQIHQWTSPAEMHKQLPGIFDAFDLTVMMVDLQKNELDFTSGAVNACLQLQPRLLEEQQCQRFTPAYMRTLKVTEMARYKMVGEVCPFFSWPILLASGHCTCTSAEDHRRSLAKAYSSA